MCLMMLSFDVRSGIVSFSVWVQAYTPQNIARGADSFWYERGHWVWRVVVCQTLGVSCHGETTGQGQYEESTHGTKIFRF